LMLYKKGESEQKSLTFKDYFVTLIETIDNKI
jgi:hypothetical protein